MESQVKKNEQRNWTNFGDWIKVVEEKMKNMENFNFSMANQMLNILKSLNENIVSLSGKLKAGVIVVEERERTMMKIGWKRAP